jgi:hypothetical protein
VSESEALTAEIAEGAENAEKNESGHNLLSAEINEQVQSRTAEGGCPHVVVSRPWKQPMFLLH